MPRKQRSLEELEYLRSQTIRYFDRAQPVHTIAKRLRIRVELVEAFIAGHVAQTIDSQHKKRVRHQAKLDAGEPLANPWLDPWDEANVEGYIVPTPEEIRRLADELDRKRMAGMVLTSQYTRLCMRCKTERSEPGRCYCRPCRFEASAESKARREARKAGANHV